MISSMAWVPAGVANPNPQKYEMSTTERELIKMMQEKGTLTDAPLDNNDNENTASPSSPLNEPQPKSTAATLPVLDPSSLPADLRMDDYSSDEEEDVNKSGVAIGQLIVGAPNVGDLMMMNDDSDNEDDSQAKPHNDDHDDDNDDDDDDGVVQQDSEDDSDDDLADVPDTREFTPVDVAGLEAMGLSHVGTNTNNHALFGEDDDDDSEIEDTLLTADDALVVIAKTEDDYASMEVHVYNQATGNLYVHHDIPLPAFPLCLAHGQVSSDGVTGNFCAVGTFHPGIEIWNLDVLNALEPSCVLGGEDTTVADDLMRLQLMNANGNGNMTAAPSPGSSGGLRTGSHTDAVLSLSWNTIHKQVLASGSADGTVKLWDVTHARSSTHEKCNASTFGHHKDKVACVAWNPNEGTLLASASYDRTVALLDARCNSGSDTANVKSVKMSADCEALCWDPFQPELLTAAGEDGTISCWDVRNFKKPLWSFVANEYGGVNDLSYNTKVPGMMVTCSVDKTVSLWDAHTKKEGKSTAPRLCGSKDMCAGKLYTVGFYPSAPWLLGCAGSGNVLALWDLSSEEAIQKRFQHSDASTTADFCALVEEKSSQEQHDDKSTDTKGKGKKKGKGKTKRKARKARG